MINNCNDCVDLENDFCKGEKFYTRCILSQVGIPYLGIVAGEELNVTIAKLVTAIQNLTVKVQSLEANL